MQQYEKACSYYEKKVALSMKKAEKKGAFKHILRKKSMANKPEKEIFQTKCNHSCVYFEKRLSFFKSNGD